MSQVLTNWYTEAEAAAAIECSVRSVQRHIEAGKIETRKRPRPGRKPENVLNPRDVDMLRPAAHVMTEAEPEANGNGIVSNGRPTRPAATPEAFFAFLATITTAIASRPDVAIEAPRPWISPDEAADLSGLNRTFILELARAGSIPSVRGGPRGALRIHRESLEAFQG